MLNKVVLNITKATEARCSWHGPECNQYTWKIRAAVQAHILHDRGGTVHACDNHIMAGLATALAGVKADAPSGPGSLLLFTETLVQQRVRPRPTIQAPLGAKPDGTP